MKTSQIKNSDNTAKIRHAELSDLDSLVELHLLCFKYNENLIVRLGARFVKAAYRWFITSNETYAIAAVIENQIVGLTVVCDGPYCRPMLKNCLFDAIIGVITHPNIILNGNIFNRIIGIFTNKQDAGEKKDDKPNVAHLAYIAAHPDFQGKRIGSNLLNESKRIAGKRGALYHRAGVYKENVASKKMFEKCGHKELPELKTDYVIFMQADLSEQS